MAYLLAKIIILLLLAALGGALLMYWWLRRRYDDVTVQFTDMQADKQASNEIMQALNAKYVLLADDLHGKLESVSQKFAPLEAAVHKADAHNELADIAKRVGSVESTLKSLPEPQEPDFTPVLGAIKAIHIPEPQTADLSPVLAAVSKIPHTDLTPVLHAIDNIPSAPEVDLTPVLDAVENIHIPETKPVDLSPVLTAIAALPEATDLSPIIDTISAIRIPETDLTPVLHAIDEIPQAPATDLSPVLEAVNNIHIPEPQTADLSPVLAAVSKIPHTDLTPVLHAIDNIPSAPEVDLTPVLDAVENIHIPETKPVDLSPVLTAIAALPEATDLSPIIDTISAIRIPETNLTAVMEAIESIDIPACPDVNLEPVLLQIQQLEHGVGRITASNSSPAVKPSEEVISQRVGDDGNRLRTAAFGLPDNLKAISGVGPKLEKMLHSLGVYYYWQVADWTLTDINKVDDLLEVFKGRIIRDDWVPQAITLAQSPSACQRPR